MLVVQNLFSCPLFIGYGIAGNGVANRISRTSHASHIAPSRFGLEHPRPYALGCYHLPSVAVRSQRRAKLSFPAACQVRKKQQPKVNPFWLRPVSTKVPTHFSSDGRFAALPFRLVEVRRSLHSLDLLRVSPFFTPLISRFTQPYSPLHQSF
jgi:hypothetical protein